MKKKTFKFSIFSALFITAVVLIMFPVCEEPPEDFIDNSIKWTFQEQIPGWKPFVDEQGFRDDYPASANGTLNPNGTTMRLDAEYHDGMTLLPASASRTIRWYPEEPAPPDSGFSDGFIMSNGATPLTPLGYFLEIKDVQGPFVFSINYTHRTTDESPAWPVVFINKTKVHDGPETQGLTPVYTDYEYTGEDIVDIQMANLGNALRIYDIIISPIGSDGQNDAVSSVAINVKDFSLAVNDIRQLTGNILPRTAKNKNVLWTSNNTNAATVSQSGLVTAVAAGTAIITAAAQDGSGKKDSVTVTVKSPLVSMTTPVEIFEALRGMKVTTNGWADMAYNGAGITYANPANFLLIDDISYSNAQNKRTAFTNALALHTDKFIIISGDIDLSDGKISDSDKSYFDQFGPAPNYERENRDITFNIGSNTTIIGINNARIMFGGLIIRGGANNIIIRNVTFWDAHGSTAQNTVYFPDSKASATALQVENNPGGSNIWVDHCKFTDGTCIDLARNYNHDGAFDIKYGRFITVSNTEFTNHDKVMLVGSNDDTSAVPNYLNPTERQITLHNNYFHGVTQRMPRTRGTQMHIYNNYYSNIGVQENSGSFMGPGANAQFIVENNYFEEKPFGGKTIEYFSSPADLLYQPKVFYNGNNIANNNTIWWVRASAAARPWEPGYTYTLKNNAVLPSTIPVTAGPTLFK